MKEFDSGTFYNSDTFEAMAKLPDGSIDMVLCDLPYGTTACKWDSVIPFEPLWAEYKRLCKPNAAIVLTASQPFTTTLIKSNIVNFRYEWLWEKNIGVNFQLCKKQPLKKHENVIVFYRKLPVYNPQGLRKLEIPIVLSNKNKGGNLGHLSSESKRSHYIQEYTNYPSTVLKFDVERGLHPTQKPVALFEYLIRTYTNEGEIILDNTAGSGTTAMAAINAGRRWICIERDEGYYNKAIERIENHAIYG